MGVRDQSGFIFDIEWSFSIIMEVPDTFVDFFEDLGIVTLENQGNLIKLLYKYSLPAMEYARNKMRFRKERDLISVAVQDM